MPTYSISAAVVDEGSRLERWKGGVERARRDSLKSSARATCDRAALGPACLHDSYWQGKAEKLNQTGVEEGSVNGKKVAGEGHVHSKIARKMGPRANEDRTALSMALPLLAC